MSVIKLLKDVDFGHTAEKEIGKLEKASEALTSLGIEPVDVDLAISELAKENLEEARAYIYGPSGHGSNLGGNRIMILIVGGKTYVKAELTHRRTNDKLAPYVIQFAEDKEYGPDPNDHYGPHVWTLLTKLPPIPEYIFEFAADFYDVELTESFREEVDPPNIVDSAGVWDDPDFVSAVWERFEEPGYATEDGAVVLDRYDVELSYHYDDPEDIYNEKPVEKKQVLLDWEDPSKEVHAVSDTVWEAEIFAGKQHLAFLLSKTKQILQKESQHIYNFAKEDHDLYYPDSPFGPLRVKSAPLRADKVSMVIEGWIMYGETERPLESALEEFEQMGFVEA